MKKLKKNDSLLESFKSQSNAVNLSKIYGGLAESIGKKTVKTQINGHSDDYQTYRPD